MSVHVLTHWDLMAAAMLVLLLGAASIWLQLGLQSQLLVATLRMVAQLLLIGFVLRALFATTHPLWIVLMGAVMLLIMATIPAAGAFVGAFVFTQNLLSGVAAAAASGILLPLLALLYLRRKRRNKFAALLPDAVDVLVRSLRAGHPLPIAISMVGREMSDPIGTEFGMTADEMTYGLDLETAMNNMNSRVGQDDLALLTVAVSIQAKTGGNLAEILSNLSKVLRARFKMRRRIKAVSAEGRISAIGLSILPFLVFGILSAVAPDFYGDVWHEPITQKILAFAVGLMSVGNIIMFRMVNFRI